MDRSIVGTTGARRVGVVALAVGLFSAQFAAAQTPPAAAETPATKPVRITGMLEKYRPPNRTLVVLEPDAHGVMRPKEVGLAPDAVVIVDGMQTPPAGLQSGRPVVIDRRPGAPMRVVQGVLPPSRHRGLVR